MENKNAKTLDVLRERESISILELFGGIGACTKALKNIGMNVNVVDYVEIDKYACKSYNAINGTNFEPQDIKEWDKDINIDLIMHGSPCQDFSVAGKQAGGDEGSGTRSSLMYETIRIIEKLHPKYIIWENVKNLLSKKHKHNFDNYINKLDKLGYNSYYQILDAQDYGIPQHRERVYTISIKKDIDNKTFEFPKKEELILRLKDILEDKVDEKYYLDDKKIKNYTRNFGSKGKIQKEICDTSQAAMGCGGGNTPIINEKPQIIVNRIGGIFDTEKSKHQAGSIYDKNGLSPSLDTMQGGYRQPMIEEYENTYVGKKYNDFVKNKGYFPKMFNPYNCKEIENVAPTQTTQCGSTASSATVLVDNKTENVGSTVRKLIPLECWRLMGFDDEDFYKAQNVGISNSQLYKQAGNSIVVKVLEKIFLNLFKGD